MCIINDMTRSRTDTNDRKLIVHLCNDDGNWWALVEQLVDRELRNRNTGVYVYDTNVATFTT